MGTRGSAYLRQVILKIYPGHAPLLKILRDHVRTDPGSVSDVKSISLTVLE